LPLQDLAQSLPGVAIAALIPGFALATLLSPRWRWWVRLAMAPGLSAGFIGFTGLAMHDVHVPFELLTVLPLIVLLSAAALFRWRRTDGVAGAALPWWLPVPALLVGLVGASVFVWALHGQVLPPDWDTATHGGLVNTIARTHDVLPLVPIPLEASDLVRPRPGFEAMAAVVSWLGAPSPAMAMGPIIAVTLVLIPVSLTLLAIETTGSVALAALVPFFALGLAFPSDQTIVGRFPEIVDSTLIVPFIVVAIRIMRGVFTRDNALLLGAVTASIWVIHGIEVFTAGVVACVLFVAVAVRVLRASPRAALIRIGIVIGATLAGAVVEILLARIPHTPVPIATQPSSVVLPDTSTKVLWHAIVATIAQTDLISPVTFGLFGLGAIALLIQRRMLWVLGAQLVLALLMVDDFYLHKFEKFWRIIYPWGDQDRILGYQYWLIPLVLGVGFLAVIDVLHWLARTRRLQLLVPVAVVLLVGVAFVVRHSLGHLWTRFVGEFQPYIFPLGTFGPLTQLRPWILAVAVAAAAVVLAWIALARGVRAPAAVHRWLGPVATRLDGAGMAVGIVAVLCVVIGAASELGVYQSAVIGRSLVTPADLTVLGRLTDTLPRGTIVMTNGGNDAGMWMTALTDLTPLVPNGSEYGTLSLPLDIALANACTDPVAAEAAVLQADVVFIGAHSIPRPMYGWDENCLSRLPNLRLITSAPWEGGVAAAFAVIKG
jgi:hypothetical protein